jgi:hypothetical protein
MSDDLEIFIKNEQKADALQEKYGLNMTFRDLYACETITEFEAIELQKFFDKTRPNYTGDWDTDVKLHEAYDKETVAMNLTESMLIEPTAKMLYESGSLDIREALELQRIRAQKLEDENK